MKNLMVLAAALLALQACGDEATDQGTAQNGAANQVDSNGKADTTETGEMGSENQAGAPMDDEQVADSGGAMGGAIADSENESGGTQSMTEPVEVDPVEEVDLFVEARDITKHKVSFPSDAEVDSYSYPRVSTGFSLGGTEFWQKWSDGLNPTYSFAAGTPFGKRCMVASAIRFQTIMSDPPAELVMLRDNSKWSGSFFNWNDDYSKSDWGDGRSARLWAWRTTLVKWISQTNRDGSCYLPTIDQVKNLAAQCASYAERGDGEIQGCSSR